MALMGTRKRRYIALGALAVALVILAFFFVYADATYYVDVEFIPIWRVFSN